MAKSDARNWPKSKKMLGLLCFVASILAQHGAVGQRVKVDPEVESYPGQSVNLRCSFSDTNGVQLTMVTWIYEPKGGERTNIAVLHPAYKPNYPTSPLSGRVTFQDQTPDMTRPSIQIQDVQMSDEGKYICEYATYPGGNEQATTQLIMLAKPTNRAEAVTANADSKKVVVARCRSEKGRPAAKISWVTTAKGNETTSVTSESDNTQTVISEYNLIPTAADNGKDISCVVYHRTLEKPESFKLKLEIQYAPVVTIEGDTRNWYVGRTNAILTCKAEGNPVPVSVAWKIMSGMMPDTVQITGNELKVLKVDEAVNTTFVCEAKNRIGTNKDQVTIFVRGTRLPEKGPTTGSIIGAIIGVIILVAIIGTGIAMFRKHKNKIMSGDGPPKYKPPPPKKTDRSVTRTTNDPSVRNTRPLYQANYPDQYQDRNQDQIQNQEQEPVTDLDAYHDDDHDADYHPQTQQGHHYIAASSLDWDEPGNQEGPPPYTGSSRYTDDYHPGPNVGRGDSFISSEMIV